MSKSWKILLLLVVCVLQKETSRFSGLSKLSTKQIFTMTWAHFYQIIFHCVYHPFYHFGFNRLSSVPETVPSLLATIHLLQKTDESCLHGALLYLSHRDHPATGKLMSFEPKVSKILHPLSSLASFKIRRKSTSTSSGPSRSSYASTCTFTLKLHLHTETSFQILFLSSR